MDSLSQLSSFTYSAFLTATINAAYSSFKVLSLLNCQCSLLSFYSALSHIILFLALPTNRSICKHENIISSWFHIGPFLHQSESLCPAIEFSLPVLIVITILGVQFQYQSAYFAHFRFPTVEPYMNLNKLAATYAVSGLVVFGVYNNDPTSCWNSLPSKRTIVSLSNKSVSGRIGIWRELQLSVLNFQKSLKLVPCALDSTIFLKLRFQSLNFSPFKNLCWSWIWIVSAKQNLLMCLINFQWE